jgi:hypothetical protein
MTTKYGKYVVRPRAGEKILNLSTRPLVSSSADELPVKRHIMIDRKGVDETVLYQAMHSVDALETPPDHYQILHSHDFVETYLFLGRNKDFTGLRAEVVLEDESHQFDSPMSVYIPVGLKHQYRMLTGSGILIVTALKSEYGYDKR